MVARDGDTVTVLRRPPAQNPEAMWRKLVHETPAMLPELTLMRRSGTKFARLLRGELDPLKEVLFPGGSSATLEHVYQSGWGMLSYDLMAAEAVAAAVKTVPAGRALRVLEVGAGTGGLTSHVLPRLPADHTRYVFTDVSNGFFSRAERAFFDYRFVEFAALDIERPPEEQGFEPGTFDVVLASDVLHATRDIRQTLAHVRSLMAPGGLFAAIEIPEATRWPNIVFGLTEGWWRFDDGVRKDQPAIAADAWKRLLAACGFDDVNALAVPNLADNEQQVLLLARRPAEAAAPATVAAESPGPVFERPWLMLADRGGFADRLKTQLAARGDRVVTVRRGEAYRRVGDMEFEVRPQSREDFTRLVEEIDAAGLSPAVTMHLWSLDAPGPEATTVEALDEAETDGAIGLMNLAQALDVDGGSAPRLIVATRGSQAIDDGAAAGGGGIDVGLRPRAREGSAQIRLPAGRPRPGRTGGRSGRADRRDRTGRRRARSGAAGRRPARQPRRSHELRGTRPARRARRRRSRLPAGDPLAGCSRPADAGGAAAAGAGGRRGGNRSQGGVAQLPRRDEGVRHLPVGELRRRPAGRRVRRRDRGGG